MSRRNPQRSGDKRTRFLANRVVQVVRRILTRGIASPMDLAVHVPRENLVHQARQSTPGEAVEVRIDVPQLDRHGRPLAFAEGVTAVPSFTLRIGYYDENIAGRHQVTRWSGGGIEHNIYLNTRVSEVDRLRTGWYDLATPWKALTPRLKHSDPTPEVVFKLTEKVVKAMASTLIHEVTHLIDWHQGRIPSTGDPDRRKKAAADASAGRSGGRRYYNDPAETNAFFQQVSHGQVASARVLLKSLRDGTITLATAVKRFKALWPSASAFAADTLKKMGQYTNLSMMSGATRKHLVKRAAGLYESMRAALRQAAKGKLRRNPGELPDHNSEGRLIHPTAAGRAAFWRWFGDSKVVDKQGRPLVVYHGTAAYFKVFDDSKTGVNGRGLWGRGHYFSAVIRNSDSYALRQGEGAAVLPSYVVIKKPLVLVTGKDLVTRLPDGTNYKTLVGPNCDGAKIKDLARARGHDGVVQFKPDGLVGDLVAFSPTQIKSAIGNRGTFDGSDPVLTNPPRYPVMPYAAAHAWEKQAAARGVSAVARSHRGFMRAYEASGSFARLSPWWKRRREGFLARHIAQAMRGENIWERTRNGTVRPTRRSLAMIMWGFMPPKKPAGCRPGVWE